MKIKAAILGSGQLSRLLVEAAKNLEVEPVVYAGSPDDSAAQVCDDVVLGSIKNTDTLDLLFSKVDVTIFESDFLPFKFLNQFKDKGVRFFPDLKILEKTSDKIEQRKLFQSLGIPTPIFEVWPQHIDMKTWSTKVFNKFKSQCVFKWAKGGYDGKGVFISKGTFDDTLLFCQSAANRNGDLIVEEKIDFVRELAQVSGFNERGDFVHYPLVISENERGVCRQVKGPATSLGVDPKMEKLAREYAEKIARELNLYGVFAIELFETQSGELYLNEMAPRVHNSGHFSIDACPTSQFENHWRAVLKQPFGDVSPKGLFVMRNLLGRAEAEAISPGSQIPNGLHLHWYGKQELRKGRKMGHLNGVADSEDQFSKLLGELDTLETRWHSQFSSEA